MNIKIEDIVIPYWILTDNQNVGIKLSDLISYNENCEDCNKIVCCSSTLKSVKYQKEDSNKSRKGPEENVLILKMLEKMKALEQEIENLKNK